MPSFIDNLQPSEAWDLVHFLRTLQPLPSPEAATWHAWLLQHANELKPIGPEGRRPMTRMGYRDPLAGAGLLAALTVFAAGAQGGSAERAATISGTVTSRARRPKCGPSI